MVKKNLLNLAALVLGFGFVITTSAFKSAPETRVKYLFHYTGPSAMTEGQVETISNWTYEPSASCPNGDQQPCGLRIDQAYIDNSGPSPVLSSTTTLDATVAISGKAVLIDSSDDDAEYLNTEL